MPTSLPIASFVVGAVLILVAIVGGNFEAFGVKLSGSVGRNPRIIAGLVGAAFIVLGVGLTIFTPPTPPTPTTVAQATTSVTSTTPTPGQPAPSTSGPLIRKQGQFQFKLTDPPPSYDFDAGQTYPNAQSLAVDFTFTPSGDSSQSQISVSPGHNAKFANGSLDVSPWEVQQSGYSTSPNPVPQDHQVPCVTSQGLYCTFKLTIEKNSLTISYTVYDR